MSSGTFIRLSYPLCAKLGIQKALLLQKILDWISFNKNNLNMKIGNEIWVKRTAQELSQDLDGNLSVRSIERYLSELINDGWIIKENFNKNSFDRTCWYSVDDRKIKQATKDWISSLRSATVSESDTANLSTCSTQIGEIDLRNESNSPNTIIKDKEEINLGSIWIPGSFMKTVF